MISLDNRLRAALNEVNCRTLADIGCDHGKLSVSALLENRAQKVFAVDISAASLQKTRLLSEEYGVKNLVCIKGDGLSVIRETPEQIVIAGMGGLEIIKILEESGYNGNIVLVPHRDAPKVREYISKRFIVEKDFTVAAKGMFYAVITARGGGTSGYSKSELQYGLNKPDSPDYDAMLQSERERLTRIAEVSKGQAPVQEALDEVIRLCKK